MDTGKATWEKAVKAVAAGRTLRVLFATSEAAKRFAQVMRVARARNAQSLRRLYPELPPGEVKSEWDNLELALDGTVLVVRLAQLPEMVEVPA